MDFSEPLLKLLVTWQNALIMVACGFLMEAFKRGPLTRDIAKKKWGKIGAYYAPFFWCWLALFIPWGLAPEDAGIGTRVLLGLVLGALTSKVFDMVVKSIKHLLAKSDPRVLGDSGQLGQ